MQVGIPKILMKYFRTSIKARKMSNEPYPSDLLGREKVNILLSNINKATIVTLIEAEILEGYQGTGDVDYIKNRPNTEEEFWYDSSNGVEYLTGITGYGQAEYNFYIYAFLDLGFPRKHGTKDYYHLALERLAIFIKHGPEKLKKSLYNHYKTELQEINKLGKSKGGEISITLSNTVNTSELVINISLKLSKPLK